MPRRPRRPEQLTGRVFRGSTAVAHGLLTPNELRGPAWRQVFRDVYACTSLPITHEVRARTAALLVLPGSVVTGRSAAVLWGVDLAGPEDDVELTIPPGRARSVAMGIRVRRAELPRAHLTIRRRVPVTTAAATRRAGRPRRRRRPRGPLRGLARRRSGGDPGGRC